MTHSGKNALITGTSSGLGLAVSKRFAALGANTIIVCRTPESGETAAAEIEKAAPHAPVRVMTCDLTSIASIEGLIDVAAEYASLDLIYVQAKRWKAGNTVGRPDIQAFVGALHGAGAPKGVFITASTFSPDARAYADTVSSPRVILIDGARLAELMIDFDVGVASTARYALKKLDADYFPIEDDASA